MCLNTFSWLQAQDINKEPVDNPYLALVEAVCISYFSIEYLLRFAGSPGKFCFLKGTMNIVDCLAIAPYYLTLFFVPQPEIGVPGQERLEGEQGVEQEESQFGDVGRIMQVITPSQLADMMSTTVPLFAGVPNRSYHEDIQAGTAFCGAAEHRPHCAHQLEGSRSAVHAGGDGDARVWQPRVLHRERGGGNRLHLHPTGSLHFV